MHELAVLNATKRMAINYKIVSNWK